MPPTRRSILSLLAGFPTLRAAKSAPRRYAFEYWDVFTRTPLAGNPLCVFLDGRGLSDHEMLALARETNLSETTFVLPDNRVRIWSPVEEYPFAGHPTLGTAMALRKSGMKQIVLQEKIGPVPVEFEEQADGSVYGEMLQPAPIFGEEHKREDIAALLHVATTDLLGGAPILNISTGRPNLIVIFKTLATVKALQPDWPRIREYFAAGDHERVFISSRPKPKHLAPAIMPASSPRAMKIPPQAPPPVVPLLILSSKAG